jgi:hypothetical protein
MNLPFHVDVLCREHEVAQSEISQLSICGKFGGTATIDNEAAPLSHS